MPMVLQLFPNYLEHKQNTTQEPKRSDTGHTERQIKYTGERDTGGNNQGVAGNNQERNPTSTGREEQSNRKRDRDFNIKQGTHRS
ncbi:hypothetical protein EYF80_030922 [Liparis tanakae]|uniref:Uncharacterized protein n=1 Tax=Liparis tanakae TaxID=230148 RepID=A0A4Z2GZD7_9TELE|nr:hypothetical protein EYF80_030922 [Liparis tanakae]